MTALRTGARPTMGARRSGIYHGTQPNAPSGVVCAIATLAEAVPCKTQTPRSPVNEWTRNIHRTRRHRPRHQRQNAVILCLSPLAWRSYCLPSMPLQGVTLRMCPPHHPQPRRHLRPPQPLRRQRRPQHLHRPQPLRQAGLRLHPQRQPLIKCPHRGQIPSCQIKVAKTRPASPRPIPRIPKAVLAGLRHKPHQSTKQVYSAAYCNILMSNMRPEGPAPSGLFGMEP